MRWPSTVVAVMWPPVSPNTPLSSMKQVTFSPRAAVWMTSCSPSFTMSPSPWMVNDERVGLRPLDAGGERRRAAVQRLEHLAVEVVRERGVAADAEDADGAVDDAPSSSMASRIERIAIGSPQPGHRLVRADVDERRA